MSKIKTFYVRRDGNPVAVIKALRSGEKYRGAPVGCVVYEFDNDGNTIKYGYSALNPKDHFDRKTARGIAALRFVEAPLFVPYDCSNCDSNLAIAAIMKDIAHNSGIPNRVRHAAKSWLSMADAV